MFFRGCFEGSFLGCVWGWVVVRPGAVWGGVVMLVRCVVLSCTLLCCVVLCLRCIWIVCFGCPVGFCCFGGCGVAEWCCRGGALDLLRIAIARVVDRSIV